MLDVRRLTYFLTIAREGSLTRAAQQLGIAQPALSHHLLQMERAFGVRLVERHARGVVVTEAGRMLQARAEKIVRELEYTEALLRSQASSPSGEIVVGVISSLAGPMTGPLLAAVSRDLPRVRLYLQEGNSQTLSRGLMENRIDLAVTLSGARTVSSEALADEPLYLVSNLALSPPQEEIRLIDALSLPLVLPTRRHVIRTIVEGAASQLAVSANVAWEIDGNATVRAAVLHGYGHTIMGRAAFESDFSEDFRPRRIIEPYLYRRIVLQRNDVAINQVVLTRITEVIREIAAGLIAAGVWLELR